jgi:hypothetical protein
LLIVDVGWKGSLQKVLQELMPNVDVHGYYVSLEPVSADLLQNRHGTMIPWNSGRFSRAMTELMFGFLEAGCVTYKRTGDTQVEPVIGGPESDRSDQQYVVALRQFLTELLEANWDPTKNRSDLRNACYDLVTRLHMFPRYWEVSGLSHWSIGTDTGGTNSCDVAGASVGILTVLSGRLAKGNVWPAGSMAFRIKNKYAVYGLQILASRIRSIISEARGVLSIAPR